MVTRQLDEAAAYQTIREQAMAKRVPMDDIANSIIHMESLLKSSA